MHAYILTRGIKHDVDRFITELQGKYLPFEYEKGKKGVVQFSVRPIQLWEMVFPEEHLQKVIKTFLENNAGSQLKRNKKYLWALRKALKSKSFPSLDPKALSMPVYKDNIEISMIGIKKDIFRNGIECL